MIKPPTFNLENYLNAISPLREAAAYELLWDQDKATVKSIAEETTLTSKAFISSLHKDTTTSWSNIFESSLHEGAPRSCKSIFHSSLHKDATNTWSNLVDTSFHEDATRSCRNIFTSLNYDPSVLDSYENKLLEYFKDAHINPNIISIGEADYPINLLDAKYPVPLLYYQGAWDLVYSPSVSVVGTRSPSEDAIKRTRKLVKALVEDDYTITSGLARGVDTVAHETAIVSGGRTTAVIGTSILDVYPKENADLQKRISKEHLLISQVPIIKYEKQDFRLNRFFFPERNKTMSALTIATVIVEAGETSGTLIQARAAIEQGRKLFILDSCFQNPELSWPEKYQKKGAIRVKDYEDIKAVLDSLKDASKENGVCPNK